MATRGYIKVIHPEQKPEMDKPIVHLIEAYHDGYPDVMLKDLLLMPIHYAAVIKAKPEGKFHGLFSDYKRKDNKDDVWSKVHKKFEAYRDMLQYTNRGIIDTDNLFPHLWFCMPDKYQLCNPEDVRYGSSIGPNPQCLEVRAIWNGYEAMGLSITPVKMEHNEMWEDNVIQLVVGQVNELITRDFCRIKITDEGNIVFDPRNVLADQIVPVNVNQLTT